MRNWLTFKPKCMSELEGLVDVVVRLSQLSPHFPVELRSGFGRRAKYHQATIGSENLSCPKSPLL
jgi:hypothetical protein